MSKACAICNGTGYICSKCGGPVSLDGVVSSNCTCPYNAGKQPPIEQCECQRPAPKKKKRKAAR